MLNIMLAGVDRDLIQAWKEIFKEEEQVTIYPGSIFDAASDALVSPSNSFGFMDGGLDYQISQFFGWQVQERLQESIRRKHHGELLVGMAEIVPSDHRKIPYIIAAPTMRVPMRLHETVNAYLATRAVFLLIKYGTLEDGSPVRECVKSVAFPGMGTGVGQIPPDICARQMKAAYDEVIHERSTFPRMWGEAQAYHQWLYGEREFKDLQAPPITEVMDTLDNIRKELLLRKQRLQKY